MCNIKVIIVDDAREFNGAFTIVHSALSINNVCDEIINEDVGGAVVFFHASQINARDIDGLVEYVQCKTRRAAFLFYALSHPVYLKEKYEKDAGKYMDQIYFIKTSVPKRNIDTFQCRIQRFVEHFSKNGIPDFRLLEGLYPDSLIAHYFSLCLTEQSAADSENEIEAEDAEREYNELGGTGWGEIKDKPENLRKFLLEKCPDLIGTLA